MLLAEIKEREYRFRLALRIGLPIFAVIVAFISHALITSYSSLQPAFFFEAILLLAGSVYFILFLLYNGFDVKIKDDVSHAFTRDYLYQYFNKAIQKEKKYTFILLSIENLYDINQQYGLKNGDKVLVELVEWCSVFFKNAGVSNIPIGHLKGADFIIGLSGEKEQYDTVLELLLLKTDEFKVDNIELKILASMTDTNYSQDINFIIEYLFELAQESKRVNKHQIEEEMNPNILEEYVQKAISSRSIEISTQAVFFNEEEAFHECFVKLKLENNKFLHPKKYMKIINKLGLGIKFELMLIEEIFVTFQSQKNRIFALNISPTSLRNDTFLSYLEELLKEQSNQLLFILSEQEYYSYTSRYNSIIKSLHQRDIRFAIDRVGTLHSSFLYLRELEIDIIRFDSFYSNRLSIIENDSIIDGFNLMAKNKGIKTWLKNIEDEESLTLAKELGIDYLQGKYLAQLQNQMNTKER